jgi:RNA recognition motif. (a.k.a. RRM, RBD, or RNP domain)
MSRLWLTNVPPEASDDELRALTKKYAPQLECVSLQREAGDGTRPIAFMTFSGGELGSVEKLADRLNGLFWMERKLGCTTII